MDTREATPQEGKDAGANEQRAPRILIIDAEQRVRREHLDVFRSQGAVIYVERQLDKLNRAVKPAELDMTLIMAEKAGPAVFDTVHRLHEVAPQCQCVLHVDSVDVDMALRGMRMGVADIITDNTDLKEFSRRCNEAMKKGSYQYRLRKQLDKTTEMCTKLRESRDELSRQIEEICEEMVTGYQELAVEIRNAEIVTAFKAELQEQLDLEEALRCALRFIVERLDATNAAVFLPNHAGGYVVGGYVNYNCDRDTAEMVLQHLADVVAPQIADQVAPIHLRNNTDIREWIGDDSAYLADSHLIALPCVHEGDNLACLMLFRDADEPYEAESVGELKSICEVFSEQLSRITRVHHRLKGLFADEHDEFGDDLNSYGDKW